MVVEQTKVVISMARKSTGFNPLGFGFAIMFFVAMIILISSISYMFTDTILFVLWILAFAMSAFIVWFSFK